MDPLKKRKNARFGLHKPLTVCILSICVISLAAAIFAPMASRSTQGFTVIGKKYTERTPSQLREAVARVEEKASELLGYPYSYTGNAIALTEGLSAEDSYGAIYADVMNGISHACRVSVDGNVIAYAADEKSVNEAIEKILALKNEMYAPHGAKVVLNIDLRCEQVYCLSAKIARGDELCEALLEGDPFLLSDAGMPDEDEDEDKDDDTDTDTDTDTDDTYYTQYALRAQAFSSPDNTSDGTFLKFRTIIVESEQIALSYETVYEYSDDYAAGVEFVRTEGKDGEATIFWEVSYENNGEEVSRIECDYSVDAEPIDEVIVVGTHPTATTGIFFWPCNSVTITSPYKASRTIFGESDVHGGLDIGAHSGTPVWASDGGVVKFAGKSGSYGNLIIIDHGNKFTTYYAHLSEIQVKKGERVFQGQQIGLVGQTGRATGPHLHFEVRYNGNRRNPLNYIGTKTCRLGEEAKDLY